MKYSIVRADYDYGTNDINLYCRDENYNKVTKKVHGFEPYGYTSLENKDEIYNNPRVYSITETDIPYIDNEEEKMILFKTESPKDVGDIRKNSPFPVHEADIPFPRRFMINKKIFSGFSCPKESKIIHPDRIKPIDFAQDPRIMFFDIETDIESDTITISCFWDSLSDKYISVVIDPKGKLETKKTFSGNHTVFYVKDEKTHLELIAKIIKKISPDVLSAWWITFDIEEIEKKCERYGIDLHLNQTNVFDLLDPYDKLYKKGSNKLNVVVETENLEVPNYELYNQRFWKSNTHKGIIVNKSHVEALVKLNQRFELIETFWNYKAIGGFEDLGPTLYHGSIIDIRLLRKYHGRYILPSKPDGETRKMRKQQMKVQKVGGKVFMPPYGRFENIAFYDMSRYYPELIIGQNLTFEKLSDNERGLFPELTLELIEDRLKYDRRLDKLTPGTPEHKKVKFLRDAIKAVLNSIFGYTGYEGSRLFKLDIFNGITMTGQDGLKFIGDRSSQDGKKLIYGDTDSTALMIQNNDVCKELVKSDTLVQDLLENGIDKSIVYTVAHGLEYTDVLNNYLKDFCSERGFTRSLELKLDRFFESILFKKIRRRVKGKWIETGVKKRYVGWVIWEKKPVRYLKIVGFEYVRSDAAPITKDIQPTVFKYILSGDMDKVSEYLRETIGSIKTKFENGEIHPTEIAVPTKLSKNPSNYGGFDKNGRILTPPDYVRGSIFSNEWLGEDIRASDQIHMLFVRSLPEYPYTDVISYTDPRNLPKSLVIDIDKQIERTIQMPIEKVIDSVDLTWKEVFTPNKKLW